MKANELRIGNLVMYNDQNTGLIPTPVQIDISDLILIQNGVNECVYNPIPLTPEILEKAGFKNRYNKNCFLYKDKIGGWEYQFNGDIFSVGEQVIKNRLQYLHQLQNLYFALTGEELNIDLC